MSPLAIMKMMRTHKPNYEKAVRYGLTEAHIYNYDIPTSELLECDYETQYKLIKRYLVKEQAKYLYYKHMQLSRMTYPYMWDQCDIESRTAWYVIALADFEDPLD